MTSRSLVIGGVIRMCGIAGWIGRPGRPDDAVNMADCLRHRGPDAQGIREWKVDQGSILDADYLSLLASSMSSIVVYRWDGFTAR